MPCSGDIVHVRVNDIVVEARYTGESAKYPGYSIVEYQGRHIIRKIIPLLQDPVPLAPSVNVESSNEPHDSQPAPVVPQVVEDHAVTTALPVEDQENGVFSINERFTFISQMVRMVATGQAKSMIVTGSGGLGKTYTVMHGLEDNEMEEDIDYVLIKGYSTARSLFSRLFEASDKLIVFDDCDSILEDKTAVNILKSALDTSSRRTVAWLSSGERDLPSVFTFTGRIIFISNKSLDRIPQPLLSRSLFVDVTMTTDEKLERILAILPKLKPGLDFSQKREVYNLILRYKNIIHDLNIRTFLKICDIRESQQESWVRLATYVLMTHSNNPD